MTKYLVLYNSSVPASQLMANATPEEMQASMAEWIAWRDEANKTAKFEFGLPLQAVKMITPNGTEDSRSNVSGYAFIEGSSQEAVVELLKSHPHLKRAEATIEVLEMLTMPGM